MWVTRVVDAPAADAWDLLVDVRRWPSWGPSVRRAELDDGSHRLTEGATGRVHPPIGPSIPFRVTELEAPRSWSWRVAGVPATAHRVEALGPDRCRVGFEVPGWAAPYAAVCRVALRRIERELGST